MATPKTNDGKLYTTAVMMMENGGWYTAAILGKQLGIPAVQASGLLTSIRRSVRYQTEETPLPGSKVKVVSIDGKSTSANKLWSIALGMKPPQRAAMRLYGSCRSMLYCC